MHIIVGLLGLAASLFVTRSHMPTAFTGFFHPAALILLLGAPPSILLVGHDVRTIWEAIRVLGEALRYRPRAAQSQMVIDLYRFGREIKQGRPVEAERALANAQEPLLREVGPLLLQPGGGAEARETLATLVYARLARVRSAEDVFRSLFRTTPAVGLMGTIVGLVNMLINLRNFEQIGPGMAVAQLATFYGLILAYGIWGPLAKRVDTYGRDISVSARLLERGLLGISEGRSLHDLRLLGGAGSAGNGISGIGNSGNGNSCNGSTSGGGDTERAA
jgi:chemotaxis protein MotA